MNPITLQTELQYLPGGGPRRAELLSRLGLQTVSDLLWYLPRDVLDLTEVRTPDRLVPDEIQTVRGVVVDRDSRQIRGGRTLTAALLDCGSDYVRGVWFNQPWMMQKLQDGQNILFSGKPKRKQARWEFSHPRIQYLDPEDTESDGGVIPKYRLTEGLRLHELRNLMRTAVDACAESVEEWLPDALREQLHVPHIGTALHLLHLPSSRADYESGRRRLILDDLLEFQLAIALRRRAWRNREAAPALQATARIDSRIRKLFPFRFTTGQNQAIREIARDLSRTQPMHRLLQADVGAGKTVVAIYSMLLSVAAGFQSVLMAPTEVLAAQHWQTLDELLEQSRVQRLLLTGSLTAAERNLAIDRVNRGEVQLVVGTQALIQEDVLFPRLGVAVIDEQHKFGVEQRARFSGASTPHVLVMTATPIPRSLCLTQYGDLDLTVIRDMPPGRRPATTHRVQNRDQQQKAWEFLRKQISAGRQAYVICPRVETESAAARDAAAEKVYDYLSRTELSEFRVALIHGQMPRQQRADVMAAFRDAETDVIISTTVVEVGVDVPNATLMVVLQAERYGLAQLHQLRGRIARGLHQGYCFLFSDSESEEALERLTALESTSDGFEIAEKDFQLRGPGDVLGTRQHGDMPLRVADVSRDAALLDEAHTCALQLIDSNSFESPEFHRLKRRVVDRFGEMIHLPQTG